MKNENYIGDYNGMTKTRFIVCNILTQLATEFKYKIPKDEKYYDLEDMLVKNIDELLKEFDGKLMETKELQLTGFKVVGVATMHMWGGGYGTIEMAPAMAESLRFEDLYECVNDNGFGCQEIVHAECDVYAVYGESYTEYVGTVEFGPNGTVKSSTIPKNYQ